MHCAWGKCPTGLTILRVCPKKNGDSPYILNMVNRAIKNCFVSTGLLLLVYIFYIA
jgi:hypothetical protein